MPRLRGALTAAVILAVLAAVPASAHTYGSCVATPAERCERWAATLDDPAPTDPNRSDQFSVAVLASADLVVTVTKDVAFNTASPYTSTSTALIRAYAKNDGHVVWTAQRADRAYVNPTAAALSPDGRTLFVTGGAYNGFPVGGATDSQLMTVAYDMASGSLLWAAHWDGRPDATDNGKAIAVSPDGTEVYVSGVTTSALGDLDYVTVGYAAADGRQLWSAVYAGPKQGGQDAVFGMAVNPVQDLLYVTGWSDGTVEYDTDYGTVAYALGHSTDDGTGHGNGHGRGHGRGHSDDATGPLPGQQMWVARYDGVGQHKSDRANAIAVSADGAEVFVSGDSYAGKGGGDYDYGTVAYDAVTGRQLWQAHYSAAGTGFNSVSSVVAGRGLVFVTGQAASGSTMAGNDAATVAYDALTGAQRWVGTVAPARQDDYGRELRVSPDGQTVYVVTSDIPLVPYTALTRVTVTAYDTALGTLRWQSSLDGGTLNALSGVGLDVSPGGDTVAVVADLKRSADPTGPASQNVYDVVTAAFAG
jgi:hypothetical protein